MGEQLNWAALAIPIFLGATVAEAWLARRRGRDLYAFGTAISDLACGSVFLSLELVFKLATLGLYAWLFEHWALVTWDEGSAIPWVIAIVGVDFLFYWWHRVSHVVNAMWAIHGVHHQSEDYNLAVALRQPALEPFSWFVFFAPLALLGVSPVVYLAAYGLNRFYQFWIHTELFDRAGPVAEFVLNTPSHHRVHHGVQDQYLDKNYGAILIVWDRLFGTFEPEVEHPHYGTTVPLRNYSPVWANLSHFGRMWRLARKATRLRDKLWVVVAHPAWLPPGVTDDEHKPDRDHDYRKYRPAPSPATRRYVLFQFGVSGLAMAALVLFEHRFSALELAAAATVLVAGYAAFAGLVEGRAWAVPLELLRLFAFVVTATWLLTHGAPLPPPAVLAIVLGLAAACAFTLPLLRPPAE